MIRLPHTFSMNKLNETCAKQESCHRFRPDTKLQLDERRLTEIEGKRLAEILEGCRHLFWDKGPLDNEKDQYVIIERILEFGTESQVETVLDYYGVEAVKKVISDSRSLSPKTVNYFALILGFSRKDTRCFLDASQRIWEPY